MVNEWVYCPRLAYLEWVEGAWADSGDTAEGRRVHARVDKASGALPAADDISEEDRLKTRAVTLGSERLGIIAKIDLLETEDGSVTPVDYKKGRRPHVEKGAYEPERVQVCAQALILEDNGYAVAGGALWYTAARERVPVVLDEDLRARTLTAISELRLAAAAARRPPPLDASPKCVRCSLAGLCLPDETNFFRKSAVPRPLNPSDEPALPLYVQTPGARVRKDGETLVIETEDDKVTAPLIGISQLVLCGPVSVTTPTLHELMRRDIVVTWASTGGWVMGHTVGTGTKNVDLRTAQYRASFDDRRCLNIARGLVAAKIRNCRTMLRRNWKGDADGARKTDALARLKRLAERAP
ncbi:MAG: CRISPR-associated protein Cas4, partial [Alphaproteobacteria bacterium]